MKVYRGYNDGGHTATPHLVTVEDGAGEQLLLHRVRHSPTGFSWSYGGSGPADLARSILWEHLGEEPHGPVYQSFKFAVVARWPADGNWELTDGQLAEWIEAYRRNRPGDPVTAAEYERALMSPPM